MKKIDQGIGAPNPDTGAFVYYNLAGAYDSNVALILTDGANRHENYERMAEVLRRTEVRGDDVHTNLEVHYGLVQWFLGKGVMPSPTRASWRRTSRRSARSSRSWTIST